MRLTTAKGLGTMAPEFPESTRRPIAAWLLLALIVSLGIMKPAIAYPIVFTDAIFVLLVVAFVAELWWSGRTIEWRREYSILLLYPLSLAPSLLASADLGQSVFKLATTVYLVGLALITASLVTSERMLRHAMIAWLAATAAMALLAVATLVAFYLAPGSGLLGYSLFHFGTLPPGNYPRFALTFFNANMLANYLTVSLGLLLIARQRGWLSRRPAALLGVGIGVAAIPTISPGLGGMALALGVWAWVIQRNRAALVLGSGVALLFVVALAVTPIVHSTAPFLIEIPGTNIVLAPAGRFLTWSAAAAEFARHPLIGHGIGIDAVDVRYFSPSSEMQSLSDAHNVFLNIAAQSGIIGLAGLLLLIAYAARLSLPWRPGSSKPASIGLGLIFLNAFVYQGLGGSFEDARHLWVLLGLLIAAVRLESDPLTREDGNNRKAGAPSPC